MNKKEEFLYIMKQSDRVLDVINIQLRTNEGITQSDLQGVIDAIIRSTFNKGKEQGKEEATA